MLQTLWFNVFSPLEVYPLIIPIISIGMIILLTVSQSKNPFPFRTSFFFLSFLFFSFFFLSIPHSSSSLCRFGRLIPNYCEVKDRYIVRALCARLPNCKLQKSTTLSYAIPLSFNVLKTANTSRLSFLMRVRLFLTDNSDRYHFDISNGYSWQLINA